MASWFIQNIIQCDRATLDFYMSCHLVSVIVTVALFGYERHFFIIKMYSLNNHSNFRYCVIVFRVITFFNMEIYIFLRYMGMLLNIVTSLASIGNDGCKASGLIYW